MKTTVEILEKARDLIRDEGKWCRGWRDDGQGRHCVVGAIEAIDNDPTRSAYYHPVVLHLSAMVGEEVQHWNDRHTHADVLELFNLAIAAELAKQNDEKTCREPVLSGAC